MFVPCVLDCGHSYCYNCLTSWFETKNSCPTCRKRIRQPPSVSLVLKNVANIINTALAEADPSLAAGLEEKKNSQLEVYNKDLAEHKVLFPRLFATGETRPTVDQEDGVRRCAQCHWEIEDDEDGRCTQCGVWLYSDDEAEQEGRNAPVDSAAEESDESDGFRERQRRRRRGEEVEESDYENDGFVVDDDVASGGEDGYEESSFMDSSFAGRPRRVEILSDDSEVEGAESDGSDLVVTSTRERQPASRNIQIDDSDFDTGDEDVSGLIGRAASKRVVPLSDSDEDSATEGGVYTGAPSRRVRSDTESEDEEPRRPNKRALIDDSDLDDSDEGIYTGASNHPVHSASEEGDERSDEDNELSDDFIVPDDDNEVSDNSEHSDSDGY